MTDCILQKFYRLEVHRDVASYGAKCQKLSRGRACRVQQIPLVVQGEPAGCHWSHLLSRENLQGGTGPTCIGRACRLPLVPLVVYSHKPTYHPQTDCLSATAVLKGKAFTVHTFGIPRGTTELNGILILRTVVCTRAVGATRSAEGDAGRKGEGIEVCCVAHPDNAGQNGCDERNFLHTIRVVPVQLGLRGAPSHNSEVDGPHDLGNG